VQLIHFRHPRVVFLFLLFAVLTTAAHAQLIISEFRVRGPNGANDEFIEIYNNSGADHTVTAASGTGYGVAASDGTTRCSIPNGTVIPNRGHYLCVNSVGYSLASYPAGNGTTATGDATYATDIPDNAGIALFNNNSGGASYSLANRMDAVGSTSEANTVYKEGTGYPALTPFSIDHAFARDECGKGGSITTFGTCSISTPKDTNNNAADFVFVDTNGTSAGAGQRLGAPGPSNLSSPIAGSTSIPATLLDTCVAATSPPNAVRDFTSDPPNNSTFGTLDLRRTFTNNTGGNVTRIRYRVVDLTTFPAPSGIADLRPRTSTAVVVTVDRPPCGSGTSNVTVQGTTLEQPPSQPNGGGFNSSLSAGTITLGTPLPNGGTLDVRFLLGIQQTGLYKLGVLLEALPGGGSYTEFSGCTNGCPTVLSIVRASANPTSGPTVDFTVTFSESVTGVDAADFALTTTGTIAGATITGVAGAGATRTVTVNVGTGTGTIRLDVVDDNSVLGGTIPLGGPDPGDGSFTTGEVYTVQGFPTVLSSVRADANPTAAPSVNFTVTFSSAVTGVDVSDFALTTTGTIAGAAVTGVTGSGATRTVTVSTGTGDGTIRLDVVDDDTIVDAALVALGGAGAGNGSFTTGEAYTVGAAPVVVSVNRLGANPTNATSLSYLVTFSESVTGVDATDFTLTLSGTVAGWTVTGVIGSGATRTVTVSGPAGVGTLRLNVVDDDTIVDGAANPLGGVGAGNGGFAGQVYDLIDASVPTFDPRVLAFLALALAATAWFVLRR
jgi:hypothetical protein